MGIHFPDKGKSSSSGIHFPSDRSSYDSSSLGSSSFGSASRANTISYGTAPRARANSISYGSSSRPAANSVSYGSSSSAGTYTPATVTTTATGQYLQYDDLQTQLQTGLTLLDDIVLKNYLSKLTDLEIVPLDETLKRIDLIRLFKVNEMVYQNNEYSTYKFASVFNALQQLNCGVFIIADSNGEKTDFYMGVRALDQQRTTSSLNKTLKNALCGHFPGVKLSNDYTDTQAQEFLTNIKNDTKDIAAVSCIANNKDKSFTDNERFIQGFEKLASTMQGIKYTAIVLAQGVSPESLNNMRHAYEQIFTVISPFASMQMSYGKTKADTISKALSTGVTHSTTRSDTTYQKSSSHAVGTAHSQEQSEPTNVSPLTQLAEPIFSLFGAKVAKDTGTGTDNTDNSDSSNNNNKANAAGRNGTVFDSSTASSRGVTAMGNGDNGVSSVSSGSAHGNGNGSTASSSVSVSSSTTTANTTTVTTSSSMGTSDNLQLTVHNKTLQNMMERIDRQLKRIDTCESLGMWESATYFLADSQESAEMAANSYKAIICGDDSGIETSAINLWKQNGRNDLDFAQLQDYLLNFIHPKFFYSSPNITDNTVAMSATSLVSGNELAIQMSLPRKSVPGFPVSEHADFGKEIVSPHHDPEDSLCIGHIFNMGKTTSTPACLSRDSLTMHTFITGSTGAGKSNTIYEIINQLRNDVPFMVIEPAKGEYKHIFGQFPDVTVYGTNNKKYTSLLRLNPFSFNEDIHIFEHIDRLVDIFNVCWPMYAAMPAVLKKAIAAAYEAVGWDLVNSTNEKHNVYPNFNDVLEQVTEIINSSNYSADTKGDYSGALCTRIEDLTTGINQMIFCQDALDDKDLFDQNVIIDLSRIGSPNTKALIMGLLVMKLNEYRMSSDKINSHLSHITVLEEAHHLLPRTSTEQYSEGANVLGKSVEMLANSIAEMRTYGEGFVIVDQSPDQLDRSVIRNTNTKIILRLPALVDRELVGLAAGLKPEQIPELTKLECGVAAVYQNDWLEPVLVKINKNEIAAKHYQAQVQAQAQTADTAAKSKTQAQESKDEKVTQDQVKQQLIYFLLKGKVNPPLRPDLDLLIKHYNELHLAQANVLFIEDQLEEYQQTGFLELWQDDKFAELAHRLMKLIDLRTPASKYVKATFNFKEFNAGINEYFVNNLPLVKDVDVKLLLIQCALCDLAASDPDALTLYYAWCDANSISAPPPASHK